MSYLINEIFYTIQGEGAHTGWAAVFCRFAGCNLWTGHEDDRATAICRFCDTDFVDATAYEHEGLLDAIDDHWPSADTDHRLVVLTGGEPAKQVNFELVRDLQTAGFAVHIETNGTLNFLPSNLDWVCVSPKTPRIHVDHGDELKLVYPQEKVRPEMFEHLSFNRFSLSPMNNPYGEINTANTKAALGYVLAHPQWKLNTQIHKVIGTR